MTEADRLRDLEDLYRLRVEHEPNHHRIELRVYVDGERVHAGLLGLAGEGAGRRLGRVEVRALVEQERAALDKLWARFCEDLRSNASVLRAVPEALRAGGKEPA